MQGMNFWVKRLVLFQFVVIYGKIISDRQTFANHLRLTTHFYIWVWLASSFFFNRMGSLPAVVRNTGHKSDTIGIAQLPQMVIPPTRSDSTPSSSLEDVSLSGTTVGDDGLIKDTIQVESSDRQSDDQDESIGSHPDSIPTEQI
jgi:hypothetical protein